MKPNGSLFYKKLCSASEELDESDETKREHDIGALIQRRMELRRALKQMHGELLRLLYEEWVSSRRSFFRPY